MKDLSRLLHARSVCLVGASADAARTAGQPLQLLLKHGYEGRIYCVNPKYREIAGQPCFASVADLPEAVDTALVTLPAAQVPEVIRACGQRGIRNVVVLSAGFEETPQGRELGAAVARNAAEGGVTVVGPNSEGLWSPSSRLMLTHGTAASRDTVLAGPVSVLSQSGSIGAGVVRQLQDAGVGCRYFVSVGNETVLTLCDCLEWTVDEGSSRAILLFVEGLRDGAKLVAAARRAAARGIALVALKAGASAAGREATASHTGKIASSARVYSSLFRQCGVIEVATLGELVEAGQVLALERPQRSGHRLAVLSASGGCRALIADAAEREGLVLAPFDAGTEAEVDRLSDGLGVATNPVDLPIVALYDPQRFAAVLRAVGDDGSTDSFLVQYANRGLRQIGEHAELLGEARRRTGKAVAVSFLGDEAPLEIRQRLRELGIVCAREPAQAVRHLAWLGARAAATLLAPRAPVVERPATDGRAVVSWEQQVDLLARCGIAVPRWCAVEAEQDPRTAASALRLPVAVKAFPQDCDHKAEAGLVLVGLRDADAMAVAVETVRSRLPAGARVLVQEMVPGGVEVLLAARVDPDFGPVLALGTGGAAVEWLADVAYLALPVDAAEVGRALETLMLARLLQPFRGRAAADRTALVQVACRLGDAFLASGLHELEVNPLFVRADGKGVIAVDVLTR